MCAALGAVSGAVTSFEDSEEQTIVTHENWNVEFSLSIKQAG
jgi:hypothetical protein